jgi:hypothetical protein
MAVRGPVDHAEGVLTLYDVLDYLIDNSSIGGAGKYKLNNAVELLRQGADGKEPVALSTDATLPAGTAGATYGATLTAAGGTEPYTWTATGLPDGLTLSASGIVGGVPAVSATSQVTLTVTDSSVPPQSVDTALTLAVA